MPLETTAALRVDLLDPGAPQIIHAVQDDSDSRKIAFSIYVGGAQWAVPDGTLVTVRYKKPDGTAGFYDTLPDGSTPAATVDGNVVTVALVPQAFTVRGNVPVQIKLYNSAGTGIATFAVVMHVSANVVSDAEIVSSDYYSVLTKQIADVLAAAEGIESNVTAAQAAADQAASSASAAAGSATAAAGSASTASTAAGQAQTAATNATNSASDAEDAKTAAETAAGSASDDATAAENAKTAAETAATNAENAAERAEALVYSGAGAHNAVYRGKNLGSSVTAEQYAAIAAGTFDDLYIGDYWTIGGVTYRIAAFDYYLQTGDTPCTDHHAVIVPDDYMYLHVMNGEETSDGGYYGTEMRTSGLDQAKSTIFAAFGKAHILSHRQYLTNAVANGRPSGASWYDSTVELMTERNIYGCPFFSTTSDGTDVPELYSIDRSQYPVFAFNPQLQRPSFWTWLRDVATGSAFAGTNSNGVSSYLNAQNNAGVRPAFSIIG